MAQAPNNDNQGLIPWATSKVAIKSADVANFITNCKDAMCGRAAPPSFKISDASPLTFNLEYETGTDFAGSNNFAVGAVDDGVVINNENWRLIGSDGRIFKFKNIQFRKPTIKINAESTLTANQRAMANFNPLTSNLIGRFDGLKKIENSQNGNDKIGYFARGTATFITSDLLITCAHNVFDGANHINLGKSPFIIFNPNKNNQEVKRYMVDWVVYPNQKVTRSTDIAFIKLKSKHNGNPMGVSITSLPTKSFNDASNEIVFSGYAGELVNKQPEGARPHAKFTNVDKNDDNTFYNKYPDAIKMKCSKNGFTHGASGSVGFVGGHSGVAIYSHGEKNGGVANCYTAYAHRITHTDFWLMCALSGEDFNTICGDYARATNKAAHKGYNIMMNDNYIQNKAAQQRRVRYHARNEYDNQDSYEEDEQDLYGYNHKHYGHNDYNDMLHDIIVYNPNLDGGSHHDTISDGYYHESGGYDQIHNESEYLVLYSIITMILIGVCCLIIAVSSILSFAAGKFHQTIKQTQKPSLHCKHEYDQIDVITEDQI